MSVVVFAAILDEWKEELTLEVMPDMTMPMPGYVAYGLMGIGAILLLVAVWRLLSLRLFRFFFTLLAALLIAYYPVAYALHWWLYAYNADVKAEQGYTQVEETLIKNLRYIDWGILGAGLFLGTILFYLTLGASEEKRRYSQDDDDDGLGPPIHEQIQAQRQRQQQGSGKSRSGSRSRPAAPPPKDPFDFS